MNTYKTVSTVKLLHDDNAKPIKLPALTAEDELFYYKQKNADSEQVKAELAACQRLIAFATEQFDAEKARQFRVNMTEKARALGLREECL